MDENQIWKVLIKNQFSQVLAHASSQWLIGFEQMRLMTKPLLEDVVVPHWTLRGIHGKAPEDIFWYRLSRGIFNVNERLRSADQLLYLEERDYFHDVFGHLPILWSKQYSDYVRALGIFGQFMQQTPEAKRALSNIYWYTSEFGLIHEAGGTKAIGAGLLSSVEELEHVMSTDALKLTLGEDISLHDLATQTDYITDGFQSFYVKITWGDLPKIIKFLWENYAKS